MAKIVIIYELSKRNSMNAYAEKQLLHRKMFLRAHLINLKWALRICDAIKLCARFDFEN